MFYIFYCNIHSQTFIRKITQIKLKNLKTTAMHIVIQKFGVVTFEHFLRKIFGFIQQEGTHQNSIIVFIGTSYSNVYF